MTPILETAFAAASPRVTPRPATVRSVAIYVAIYALWGILMSRAWLADSLFAWSVGIVYVSYDTLLLGIVAWQSRRLAHTAKVPLTDCMRRPTLSAVIAAYNEAPGLAATIDALVDQDDPPDLIVLADDGSTDESCRILFERYGLEPPSPDVLGEPGSMHPSLRWLRLRHRGKAAALNSALLHATTDIVVTVDADTLLARDALAAVRRAFQADPELVVAGGILTPRCDGTQFARCLEWFQTYEYIRNFISRYAWSQFNCLLLISGAFAACRRDALLAVGGFDTNSLVEDYDLTHRIHRYAVEHGAAWRIRILGDAQATTEAPGRILAFLRQRRRWFAGFLQTQYWNRDMTGERRFGWLGLLMMPVKAADTVQPIYGLSAILLLPGFVAAGHAPILLSVAGVMLVKIAIDLSFYLWSIELYRRWTNRRIPVSLATASLAAVIEPFSFQLLRHLGAAWGWVRFLSGERSWGAAARSPTVQREVTR